MKSKTVQKGAGAKSLGGTKNTKSRPEVIADTGRRVSKARNDAGQHPRGNTKDKRDARDRAETSGYADDTLAGKSKPKAAAKAGKGADTDKTYGSGRGDAGAGAREWDEGGTRSRRGAPRAQEGRAMSDGEYGDSGERNAGKLKGGAVKAPARKEGDRGART